jgi:hypothetical protein
MVPSESGEVLANLTGQLSSQSCGRPAEAPIDGHAIADLL